jgi:multicomponent Na+:H+ antiporter subunit D
MAHTTMLSPLPVALPLLGAAAIAALRKWINRAVADSLGIAIAGATLLICSLLLIRAIHGTEVYWFGDWYPRGSMVLGIGFILDPVGTGLAALASLLTLLALLFSWRFVDSGSNHLQPLMLVFLAAMCGFVLTGDLFNLFVFFELMSTAAFALCGLKIAEPAPLQGSFNFAVTNTIAAFLVLTGIAFLYAVTGALNMAQIGLLIGSRHDPLLLFAFTLLTCGFLIKAAIAPFHLWLPDAHAVAPTPVCVLFSGMMVELGLYAVVRLRCVIFAQSLAAHASALRGILLVFAAATILLGGLMCYAEHHLKRMLAFSTICHAGLMLVAIAIGGPLAIAGMLVYLLAHAFVKSSLFFTSGVLRIACDRSVSASCLGEAVSFRGWLSFGFLAEPDSPPGRVLRQCWLKVGSRKPPTKRVCMAYPCSSWWEAC